MRIPFILSAFAALSLPLAVHADCAPDALGVSRVLEISQDSGPISPQLAEKEVVITYDDGPGGSRTRKVLKELEAECVTATFFLRGDMAKRRRKDVQRIAAAGHTIGGHGWAHANLALMEPGKAKRDIQRGLDAIEKALDWRTKDRTTPPVTLFRYPFLATTPEVTAIVREMGLIEIGVTADGEDWAKMPVDQSVGIVMTGLEAAGNRGIILLHDPFADAPKRTRRLLDRLKQDGFSVVALQPVSE